KINGITFGNIYDRLFYGIGLAVENTPLGISALSGGTIVHGPYLFHRNAISGLYGFLDLQFVGLRVNIETITVQKLAVSGHFFRNDRFYQHTHDALISLGSIQFLPKRFRSTLDSLRERCCKCLIVNQLQRWNAPNYERTNIRYYLYRPRLSGTFYFRCPRRIGMR